MRETLIRARKEAGYTQAEIALAAGVSRSTYAHYELDDRDPPVNRCLRIARFLRRPVEELFGEDVALSHADVQTHDTEPRGQRPDSNVSGSERRVQSA